MIEFTNVTKTYKTGVTALKGITLRIQDGEFCFIVGRSGSGKSTLVRLLTKELDPDEGSIIVNDTDLTHLRRRHIPKYRRRLGVVFQDFRLLEDRTVYENIGFAQLIIGKTDAEIRENVSKIMELTGLSSKSRSYPRQLSGGEQQRTAIARALVNRPEILIADEPTGNLDHENAQEIMNLLERINEQGTTVIVITHDREMVKRMKKRTVRMSLGEIISDTIPEEDVIPENNTGASTLEKADSSTASNPVPDSDISSDRLIEKTGESIPEEGFEESIKNNPEESVGESIKNNPEENIGESIKNNPAEKPRRGLKGSHRPHHRIGKEDA
jgi:cell division transport system ATP-binding protein